LSSTVQILAYFWGPNIGPQIGFFFFFDSGRYCQSMNFLAGSLLLFMDEETAFWMLVYMVEDLLPNYFVPCILFPFHLTLPPYFPFLLSPLTLPSYSPLLLSPLTLPSYSPSDPPLLLFPLPQQEKREVKEIDT
jgi:hypothetical protein